jgi:ubiquitin C-terminal hydrolase
MGINLKIVVSISCLLVGAAYAASPALSDLVRFHKVEVVQAEQAVSAHHALFNALYFVGKSGSEIKPSSDGSIVAGLKLFSEALQDPQRGQKSYIALSTSWDVYARDDSSEKLNSAQLLKKIVVSTKKYRIWQASGWLSVFESVDLLRLNKYMGSALDNSADWRDRGWLAPCCAALSDLDATKARGEATPNAATLLPDKISFVVNISTDPSSPRFVAVGALKRGGVIHICTMDSTGDAFASKADGGESDLTRAVRLMFSPVPSRLGPPVVPSSDPGSTADSPALTGGGSGGLGDAVVDEEDDDEEGIEGYDPALYGPDVVPGVGAEKVVLPHDPAESGPIAVTKRILRAADPGGDPIYSETKVDKDGFPLLLGMKEASPAVLSGDDGGIWNNGMMCYQNGLFQAIGKCAPLQALLLAGYGAQRPRGDLPMLVRKFFEVEELLANPVPGSGAIDPKPFCLSVQNTWPDYKIGVQQDAPLFLQYLWKRFQDAGIVSHPERFDDGFHGFAYQDRFTCNSCAISRESPSPAALSYLMELPFPPVGTGTLNMDALFTQYGVSETLAGRDAVFCPTCAEKTEHVKQPIFRINPSQRFLVLYLKRFYSNSLGVGGKLVTPVTFDDSDNGRIIITDAGGVPHQFRVASVVVHKGTLAGGHYWTVGWNGTYNDEHVTFDGGEAMKSLLRTGLHSQPGYRDGTPYLYFLERISTGK